MNKKIFVISTLLVVAAFSRLIPHAPNFTAVGAMALFAGYMLPRRWALALPVAVLFLTDLIIGFHSTMFYVYAAMTLVSVLGLGLQKSSAKTGMVLGSSLLGSLLFFAVTNFAVWMVDGLYAPTFQGLVECYMMAIPFLKNQVAGDLFFTSLFFMSYALVRRALPVLRIS